MASKKGQGLPLNLIVLAAIAALVLVLIIAFTVGGAGAFFGQIFKGGVQAAGQEIDTVRTTCNSLCSQAQQSFTTAAWKSSAYCSRTVNLDFDKDGVLGCPKDSNGVYNSKCATTPTKNAATNQQTEVGLKCKDTEINVACSTTIGGSVIDQTSC